MCATFLLDVAVLTFVFPILDTIVQHGKQSLTGRLVVGTFGISGVYSWSWLLQQQLYWRR